MKKHEPSFYRMFRRSHYCKPIPREDEEDYAKFQEQRERFTAAALGFCLKHSDRFREYFWAAICRTEAHPKTVPPLSIEVEPADEADLRLTSHLKLKKYVWVVEIKTGAELRRHQNPKEREFWQDGGYGFKLGNEDAYAKCFTVLGADQVLGLSSKDIEKGVSVQERAWDVLLQYANREPLVHDLFESLGLMGIHPFSMEKIRNVSITGGLSAVGDAWAVLEEVCRFLGARNNYGKIEAYTEEDGSAVLGAYIRQPPAQKAPAANHLKLKAATGLAEGDLAWFGYITPQNGTPRKTVWVYCADEARQKTIQDKLKASSIHSQPHRTSDTGVLAVIVNASPKEQKADYEWFAAIFKAVGV